MPFPYFQPFNQEQGFSLGDSLQKFNLGASQKTLGLAGLQGLTSFAGTLTQINAARATGQSAKQSAYFTAQNDLLNANQAYVAGQGEVNSLRQQLQNAVGGRAAIAAASGVDGGQGVVQDNNATIAENARIGEGVTRANADIVAARQRANAIAAVIGGDQAEREANRNARAAGVSGLLGGLLSIGKLFL